MLSYYRQNTGKKSEEHEDTQLYRHHNIYNNYTHNLY
jgi:hypothetical protein